MYVSKGAYHKSEIAGHTGPLINSIPLLIRTIWPDQSIIKSYAPLFFYTKKKKTNKQKHYNTK